MRFDPVFGLHQWEIESINDLFEEYPELRDMTIDELKEKSDDFYAQAAVFYERSRSLEATADTIKLYIKYFRNGEIK